MYNTGVGKDLDNKGSSWVEGSIHLLCSRL